MERVVQRAELASSQGSRSSSPDPGADARFLQLADLDYARPAQSITVDDTKDETPGDEELDFRLFASSAPVASQQHAVTAQKIRLRSSSPATAQSGFVRAEREPSYYFIKGPSPQVKHDQCSAAVTGDQVVARSQSDWPGSTYCWKVLTIPRSGVSKVLRNCDPSLFPRLIGNKPPIKRTRPGKKYRIKVRIKKAATESKNQAAKAAADAKEAAEREKRTRRNREKKVKKKLREKAKKTTGTEAQNDSVSMEEDAD